MTHSPFLGSGIVGQKPFMHVLISSKFAILVCSSFNLIWHSRLMPLSCTSRACAAPVARNSAATPIRSSFICVCSPLGLRGALLLENALHFLRRCFTRRETVEPKAVIAFPGLSIKLPSYPILASSDDLPWSELRGLRVRRKACNHKHRGE